MQRAFYLLSPGGWRDYINLLHVPYTAWHLSYVGLGAALVGAPDYQLLGWTLLAFFLALGIGAHSLDELRGRPLGTRIPAPALWAIGIGSVSAACAIGLMVGAAATPQLLPFVALGAFLVFAYNLELGPFHHDLVFALAWGAFPVLTSYLAQTGGLSVSSVAVAVAAAGMSGIQRMLSKRVRYLRRGVVDAGGFLVEKNGGQIALSREWLARDHERALLLLSAILPILAIGLLLR